MKPVLIIAIVFSIAIALVGVVAMTNTTDDTSAANNTPAANNAGLTANQLANNAAAEKAYKAAISKEYAQSNQPDTEIRFGDPDYVYLTEEEAAASKAALAKMHEVAERVRATEDLREEKRERDYGAAQTPTTNYGSSAYNTPQAPTTNYGSAEPYVPPKLDFKPIQIPKPKYQFKEPDRSVITDHKLDFPKMAPMPKIPVPLPGCGIGCIPEVLKLP